MRLTQPGIYALSDAEYLADPVIEPSLNNSTARLLVDLSPAHAYAAHSRLGGAATGDESITDEMSIGTAAHAMFLRGVDIVRLVPFDDFRTKLAREARDAARADGKVPLKPKDHDAAHRVVEALERFRRTTDAFTAGRPEQTLVWQDGGIWCRCKVDWLPDDPAAPLWDLKTTGGTASPRVWSRVAFEHRADMQAAFYARGAESVRGEPPDGMFFCVVEIDPPHGIRVFGLSPPAIDLAEDKVRLALRRWAECRASGEWPGYAPEPEWIDPPPWVMRDWEGQRYVAQRRGTQPMSEAVRAVVARMVDSGNLAG